MCRLQQQHECLALPESLQQVGHPGHHSDRVWHFEVLSVGYLLIRLTSYLLEEEG